MMNLSLFDFWIFKTMHSSCIRKNFCLNKKANSKQTKNRKRAKETEWNHVKPYVPLHLHLMS